MKKIIPLLSLLLSCLLATAQTAPPYGNNPAAGHYQLVRGVKLYYETYGQGPPLLLHGNGGDSTAWAIRVKK